MGSNPTPTASEIVMTRDTKYLIGGCILSTLAIIAMVKDGDYQYSFWPLLTLFLFYKLQQSYRDYDRLTESYSDLSNITKKAIEQTILTIAMKSIRTDNKGNISNN